MKKIHILSTVFAVAMLPQVASATNFYVGGAAGVSLLRNAHIEGVGTNLSADFDTGWAGVATVGHRYYNNIRAELELGYRTNDADRLDGNVNTWSLMANALYDFAPDSRFTPYIGAGAGLVHLDYDNVRPVGGSRIDDTDIAAPALQAIVGASYNVNDKVSLFANYQYLTAFNPDVTTDAGTRLDTEYNNQTILVGVRYNFGGPQPVVLQEPAPEPVAAPAPAKAYQVFFDFNESTITPEARKTLEEAAATAHTGNVIRITLTGHADRAGSDKYNQRLSETRAKAVKNALSALGVTNKEIAVVAKGEHDPLVATEDGVREPQNRRVEIVYTTK